MSLAILAAVPNRVVLLREQRLRLLTEKRYDLTPYLQRLQSAVMPLDICSKQSLEACVLESEQMSVLANQLRVSCPKPTDWELFTRNTREDLKDFSTEFSFQSVAKTQLKIDQKRLECFRGLENLKTEEARINPHVLKAFKVLIYVGAFFSTYYGYKAAKEGLLRDLKVPGGILMVSIISRLISETMPTHRKDKDGISVPNSDRFIGNTVSIASFFSSLFFAVDPVFKHAKKIGQSASSILAAYLISKTLSHFYAERLRAKIAQVEMDFETAVEKIDKEHPRKAFEISERIIRIIQRQLCLEPVKVIIPPLAMIPTELPPPYVADGSVPVPYQPSLPEPSAPPPL